MTTEASPNLQAVALDIWLVTFVMTAGQLRRAYVLTFPATSHQAALSAAYETAVVFSEATDGVWTPAAEFSAEVVS